MKLSKKMSVLSLTAALLLSSVSPVLASDGVSLPASAAVASAAMIAAVPPADPGTADASEAKISKDKAVELAKSYVQIPENYELKSINYNSNSYGNGVPSWNLSFGKKDDQQYYSNLNVGIDSDSGKLLNYNFYENDPTKKPAYPPKVDLKAAKAIANQLLQKYNADQQNNLKYNDSFEKSFKTPLSGDVRYTFTYNRVENGIVFQNNYVSLTIDGSGKFVSYDQQWNPTIKFADASKAITVEQATYAFQSKSVTSLTYLTPWGGKAPIHSYLGYNLISNAVDANTGEIKIQYGTLVVPNTTPLTEKPLAEMPAASLNLTKDQAIKAVSALISLPEKAVFQDASYNENVGDLKVMGGGAPTWNLNWIVKGEKASDSEYINASINSKTGQLVSYSHNTNMPLAASSATATKISVEKAKAAAIDFIKKVVPQYTDQLAFDDSNLNNLTEDIVKTIPSINFNFRRVVQGILTENESVNVGINTETGEVTNYYSNFSTIDYPTVKPTVISEKAALDKLLSQYTVELLYTLPAPDYNIYNGMNSKYDYPTANKTPQEATPNYVLVPKYADSSVFLDAVTGDWRKRDTGDVTTLEKTVVTDIENHWGQNEIQLMIDYNALDVKDGKVLPDQAITRGEMIKMLVIAMNGGNNYIGSQYSMRASSFSDVKSDSAYFPYIESAVDAKIIDPGTSKTFNPDGQMNRDEFAQLIVRALGYDKLAEYTDLFKLDLKDEAQIEHKGQVAIAVALGILTASDNSFMPQQEVSRAQAAIAFSRYLQKRSVLQDMPINAGMGMGKG